jgi:hypothetical protein
VKHRWWLLRCVGAFVVVACGANGKQHPRYPRYTPAEAALFDNAFDPSVIGPASRSRRVDWDAKLIERTEHADAVFRGMVVTIEEVVGGAYRAEVRPLEGVLAGEPPQGSLWLSLASGSSTARTLENGTELVGRRVVLFIRRHASIAGPVVHFHAEPDDPKVLAAVRKTLTALDEGAR